MNFFSHTLLVYVWVFILLNSVSSCISKISKHDDTSLESSLTELNAQIFENPKEDSLYFIRAQLFVSQEKLDSAQSDIQLAIHLDSLKHPQYYFLLSDIQVLNFNSKDAISTLNTARTLFPDNIDCILRYAKLQLILKQHVPALLTLDKIYNLDPQNAEAHYLAGHIFLDMGDTTKALLAFQRSVANDPDLKPAWLQLGDLSTSLNDSIALRYYDNAIKLDSNDVESIHNKAYALKLFGKRNESIELYRQIIERFSDYEPSYYNLGLLYMEIDSFRQAISHFDKSTELNPQEAAGFYHRGICYEKLGQVMLAKSDYVKAYLLDTQWVDIKKAIQRLK